MIGNRFNFDFKGDKVKPKKKDKNKPRKPGVPKPPPRG